MARMSSATVPKRLLPPDVLLAEAIARFYADPLGYVMFNFPWDTEESIQVVKLPQKYRERFESEYGPDSWACDFLDEWGQEIKRRRFDGKNAVAPISFSTASGHGIGKTTLTAFVIKFIMDTREFAKGTVTAGTDTQLRTKTWAELAKWHRLSQTAHWFNLTSTRGNMMLAHKKFPEEWRCTAQTCRAENADSFQGQHNLTSTSFYIFDEASAVPDPIYVAREGGLTDGEPMTFDFGNPVHNTGRFFENMKGRFQHRFIKRFIDSRDVSITNKEYIEKLIADHGIDSDYVKVRVLGEFPSVGSLQFIPTSDVLAAQLRDAVYERHQEVRIGVDVARFGSDESVIYPRIGNDARSFEAKRYRGLDTVQLSGRVIEMVKSFQELGKTNIQVFVDGTGLGAGVVDVLRSLNPGFGVHEVLFGGAPVDTKTYRFRVGEIWDRMRKAIKGALALPNEQGELGRELKEQLTQRQYGFTLKGQVHLEPKDEMKKRGLESPDLADALALTYATDTVNALKVPIGDAQYTGIVKALSDYDPLNPNWQGA